METQRLHVNLVADAAADLETEKTASKMNGADIVNRAIQLYHFLMNAERLGREICLNDPRTGEIQRVTIEPDRGSTEL